MGNELHDDVKGKRKKCYLYQHLMMKIKRKH